MPNSDPQTCQHFKWRSGSGLAADSIFKGPRDPEVLKPNTFILVPASGSLLVVSKSTSGSCPSTN